MIISHTTVNLALMAAIVLRECGCLVSRCSLAAIQTTGLKFLLNFEVNSQIISNPVQAVLMQCHSTHCQKAVLHSPI
jgi:hypothetical protein